MRVYNGLGNVHKGLFNPGVSHTISTFLCSVLLAIMVIARQDDGDAIIFKPNYIATSDNPATSTTPPTKCRLPVTNTCEAPRPLDRSCSTNLTACSTEGKT